MLHFDGKEIKSLTNNSVKEERLPILVGNSTRVKLLGSACWKKGSGAGGNTGNLISKSVISLLEKYDCKKEIKALSFDTTLANTGHDTAANVKIQASLDSCLLWCACRHDVGEVIAGDIYKCLKIEITKSPESVLFGKYKSIWDDLDKSGGNNLSRFEIESTASDEAVALFETLRVESIQVIKSVSEFLRDDYKQLSKLSLAYLCDTEHLCEESIFNRPGGLSHARWMTKLICSLQEWVFKY